MSTQTLNSIASKELYTQYSWYKDTFAPAVQKACDEFFLPGFRFDLVGISKNINVLMNKDSYFVTKIRINKDYDMFFRSSEQAVSIILDKALGKTNKVFKLNKMTDLEAKIITSFNDYMFGLISNIIQDPPATELKRTNFDVINLTFVIKNIEEEIAGRFIMSLPAALLKPESIQPKGGRFENTTFSKSLLDVSIKIGSTRFTMYELKNLDLEDIVIFDNSNVKKMTLVIDDYEKEINLRPNMGLITPVENNGGDNMGADNLWDSIEVEMNAQFDAVKITLGDLKNIEEGNVVDLTSIYDNRVTLSVEDKIIAKGQLVIVNDRYGVKVDEVLTQEKDSAAAQSTPAGDDDGFDDDYPAVDEVPAEGMTENAEGAPAAGATDEDEFDYSDFELDDEDI